MKKHVLWISASLLLSLHAAAGPVLDFQDLTYSGPAMNATLPVDGLPALSRGTFLVTGVAQSQQLIYTGQIFNDATFGNYALQLIPAPKDDSTGDPIGLTTIRPRLLVADAHGGIDADTSRIVPSAVTLGVDLNGDGRPQSDEILCTANYSAASGRARCIADIAAYVGRSDIKQYWMMVQLPVCCLNQYIASEYYASLPVLLSGGGGIEAPGSSLLATGPGHANAGAAFSVRVASAVWSNAIERTSADSRANPQPVDLPTYAAVLIDADSSQFGQGAAGILPFTLTRRVGSDDANNAFDIMPSGDAVGGASIPLAAGETLRHWFFDLPTTTDGSSYSVSIDLERTTVGVSFSLVHAPFPDQSASPVVDASPSIDQVTNGSRTTLEADGMAPGRWFIVASNNDDAADALVYGWIRGAPRFGGGSNPTIAPGFYYNQLRSGHGLALSQAGGQQVLDWFTYLEDGTPTWYEAQAAAPPSDSGWWNAPLFRVAWDGSKAHLTLVGDVTLTPVAENDFMFTWHLDGESGSERFGALARTGACPDFNGVTTNFTGAWYAPAQSGYGMDVLSLPEQQFAAFYFYDDLGLARWGVGGSVPFAESSTLTLTQNTGFCPSCAYAPITTRPLGTVSVNYASASTGTYSSDLALKSPLSGVWNIEQPIARLTGNSSCP